MKQEREAILFKDQSTGFKIFIVVLCIMWSISTITAILNLSLINTVYNPVGIGRSVLSMIIILFGIWGYLANRRNLAQFFLIYYLILTIYGTVQIIPSYAGLLEYYSFNQLAPQIAAVVTAIMLKYLLCFFAYRYLPSKEDVQ